MSHKQVAFSFPRYDDDDDGKSSSFFLSFSFEQYLIVENHRNLVRAILFVLNGGLDPHDYDSRLCHANSTSIASHDTVDLSEDICLDIERRLLGERISLLACRVIHNNSLYIPFDCPTHESHPRLTPIAEGDGIKWSLHILK